MKMQRKDNAVPGQGTAYLHAEDCLKSPFGRFCFQLVSPLFGLLHAQRQGDEAEREGDRGRDQGCGKPLDFELTLKFIIGRKKSEGTDVLINLTDPGWCRTD